MPVTFTHVGPGWAKTSVNAPIFRRNSMVTHNTTQYLAFYDPEGFMVLAKRELGSEAFTLHKTRYQGNVRDAHNVISLMVDGQGFLHVAFDHHVGSLIYAKSLVAGGLELSELLLMTGELERHVTYPEFYRLADGNLLFLYRDGSSGQGNLVLNHYNCVSQHQQVSRRKTPFTLSGKGSKKVPISRPQIAVDGRGQTSKAYLLFRDEERNNRASVAICNDLGNTYRTLEGLDNVAAQLSLDFPVGGIWESEDALFQPAAGQTILHKRGKARMIYGHDVIELSTGHFAHGYLSMHNSEPQKPAQVRVLLTFLTPVDIHFTLKCYRGVVSTDFTQGDRYD